MRHCAVGIIGAGIHGAAVAHHLARRGVPALVVERGTPACGPTGRSSAVCRASYTNPFLAEVAVEGIAMLAALEELTDGGHAGFRRTGMLYLHGAADASALDDLAAGFRRAGVDASAVSHEALADAHPWLSLEDGEGAVWEAGAGHADPSGTTQAFVADAVRHGATLEAGTAVAQIALQDGGGARLTLADGRTCAVDRLLVAAGPWTRPLLQQIGVDLPLIVERHIVATFGWGGAAPVPYVLGDVPGGYYLKPEGETQYGLGSLLAEPEVDADDFAEHATVDEALELAAPAIRRRPDLELSETLGGWGSLYDVSPDWQPVIGEVADGVFVSAGTSGHGFKLAPALGRHIADLMTDGPCDARLDQFSPGRFAAGVRLAAGFGAARILG